MSLYRSFNFDSSVWIEFENSVFVARIRRFDPWLLALEESDDRSAAKMRASEDAAVPLGLMLIVVGIAKSGGTVMVLLGADEGAGDTIVV